MIRKLIKKFSLASILLALSFLNQVSYGAVIVEFVPASFVEGSGVQEVIIRARSNSNDFVGGLTLDFALPDGGTFSFVSQQDFVNDNIDPNTQTTVTSGPFYTRRFNEADYIGFGVIDKSGSYLVIDPAPNATLGSLSLDFGNSNILFPNSFQPLGKLRIDVTGLAIGPYTIQVLDGTAFGTGPIAVNSTNGTFNITAIPEPSTLALLLTSGVSLIAYHRRKQLTKCS